jgi:hypothetical protein
MTTEEIFNEILELSVGWGGGVVHRHEGFGQIYGQCLDDQGRLCFVMVIFPSGS